MFSKEFNPQIKISYTDSILTKPPVEMSKLPQKCIDKIKKLQNSERGVDERDYVKRVQKTDA